MFCSFYRKIPIFRIYNRMLMFSKCNAQNNRILRLLPRFIWEHKCNIYVTAQHRNARKWECYFFINSVAKYKKYLNIDGV